VIRKLFRYQGPIALSNLVLGLMEEKDSERYPFPEFDGSEIPIVDVVEKLFQLWTSPEVRARLDEAFDEIKKQLQIRPGEIPPSPSDQIARILLDLHLGAARPKSPALREKVWTTAPRWLASWLWSGGNRLIRWAIQRRWIRPKRLPA